MVTRRQFLKTSAVVSLAPWVPTFLSRSIAVPNSTRDGRILVVVQLDGGNDGLNTVIPFGDENYARHRPTLKIAARKVRRLDKTVGLHPEMKGAAKLFEAGRLAIVQGVGYPNPNRSHFESMAIWQHGRVDLARHDSIGWLGRAADGWHDPALSAPDSIFAGPEAIPIALRGNRANTISMENESDLQVSSPPTRIGAGASANSDDISDYVGRTLAHTYEAARRFNDSQTSTRSDASYPSTELAGHLKLVSRLIKMDGGTRVFYVSQSGYDTHAAQADQHGRLLGEFSAALAAFLDDLRQSRLDDRVVLMSFSEFGRRVQENASGGTDHGAAAPVFVAGKPVQGRLINDHPSLVDLDEGDLKMSVDFRQIYATILTDWLGLDASPILGKKFAPLKLFTSAQS
jgi:uncharacterized protein (DUF1501 family)